MTDFAWEPISPSGDYVDGAFRVPRDPEGAIRDVNPGDPRDVIGEFPWRVDTVDDAVAAARAAFPKWRDTPFEERAALLRRYEDVLKRRHERVAQAISRDMGKMLWEGRQEVDTMVAKVGVTLGEGMRLVDDHVPAGLSGRIRYLPRGVLVVVGPFNFPGHLPNGHIVPALATGNTIIFKPASHTPSVGQVMAECFDEAGFPPGVVNVVQLPGRHGDRLVGHEDVDGVLFTGSTDVGKHIERIAVEQPWKMTALEMGGKNTAIVLDDAPFEQSVYEVLTGAFQTAGQRCTATSRVVLQRGIASRFTERLVDAARALAIGAQEDPGAFLGPMVDRSAAEEFDTWQRVADDEGVETLLRGGLHEAPPHAGGAYVRPSIHRVERPDPARRYEREELFAPDTCIYVADSLEEGIAIADDTEYGLACSIFTERRDAYEAVVRGVCAGVVNWNRSTAGASGRLPFGGLKKSGNGHPAALFSTLYCTYPVASLEDDKGFDPTKLLPGVRM